MTIYNPNISQLHLQVLWMCTGDLLFTPYLSTALFQLPFQRNIGGISVSLRKLSQVLARKHQTGQISGNSNSIFMSNQVLAYESFPPPQVSIYPMVLHGIAMHVGQDAYSTLPMSRFLLSRDQKLLWSRHLGLLGHRKLKYGHLSSSYCISP